MTRRVWTIQGSIGKSVALGAALFLAGCSSRSQQSASSSTNAPLTIVLESRAFANNMRIPRQYTSDSANTSPPLNWQHIPSDPDHGAQALALICYDSDAPHGNFVHWLMWNVPPGGSVLAPSIPRGKDVVNGAQQGKNDFGVVGYSGPKPPKGQSHRYIFEVFALDQKLTLPAGSSEAQLRAAMQGHTLARGELTTRYP